MTEKRIECRISKIRWCESPCWKGYVVIHNGSNDRLIKDCKKIRFTEEKAMWDAEKMMKKTIQIK
ncbi:MAG TPA: hypothetical protein DCK95_06925 [Anaerolineaceae bacterium]|nr:hypothetical protein [Anaerolineaceae bacterium]